MGVAATPTVARQRRPLDDYQACAIAFSTLTPWGLRRRFRHSALGIAMADRPPACLPAGRASALRHHVGGRGGGWAWGRHVGRTRETCRAANRRDRVICGDGEGSSLPRVGRDHTSPSIGSQVARIGGFATATRWATRCAARGGNGRSGSPSPLLAGPVPQMRSRQWRGLACTIVFLMSGRQVSQFRCTRCSWNDFLAAPDSHPAPVSGVPGTPDRDPIACQTRGTAETET